MRCLCVDFDRNVLRGLFGTSNKSSYYGEQIKDGLTLAPPPIVDISIDRLGNLAIETETP